ncbi:MAG: hypothetical protein AAB401_24510 [Acidobacteriota bacterium]
MSLEVLNTAARRLPGSTRVQFRLAETEIEAAANDSGKLASAQQRALHTVNLSPWDYKNWRLLALAKEADGNIEEAEAAIQVARTLAPNHSEVNWMLANLLLRQNRQSEALNVFQVATMNRSDLLPVALDLIWQASGNDLAALNKLVNGNANAKLAEAQFLGEQSQPDSAISVFRSVDTLTKLTSPNAPAFITWLIQSNRGLEARQLWLDVAGEKGNEGNGVWNGSFEQNAPKDFGHFDWAIKASNYARIGFDRSVAHSGLKSLKLLFVGRDTTRLENEIQQLVVLKANVRYRLECFAKTGNLVTPEGPRIALVGQKGILAVSQTVVTDSLSWQHLVADFTAPPENTMAHISVVRIPKSDYDEPTKGAVWFDDFKLTEQ